MHNPTIIRKSALAIIKDKQLLLVRERRKPEAFYLVGGRLEEGEDEIAALVREIKEEIDCELQIHTVSFLHEFETPAHGRENTLVNVRLYTGKIVGEMKPASEIEELRFFDSHIPEKHVTHMTRAVLTWLRDQDLIS